MSCNHIWKLHNQDGCKCTVCGEMCSDVITMLNDAERHIEKLEKEIKQTKAKLAKGA